MTIKTEISSNDYIGSDSTDTYSYTFKIFLNTDLVVTQADDSGVETVLVLDVDYTVTGAGDTPGGTVVLTAGNLPTDYALNIVRDRAFTQLTDIRNEGDFNASIHEDTFDVITMLAQWLKRQVDRSFILPTTVTGVSTELPVPVAGEFLQWDDTAGALQGVAIAALGTTVTSVNPSLTLAAAQLSVTVPNLQVTAGGAVDAMTATASPAPASLTDGLRVQVASLGANVTAVPEFDLNGLGSKVIVKDSDTALSPGDIPGANAFFDLVYDLSLAKWVLMGSGGSADRFAEASGTDTYAVTMDPAVSAYEDGLELTIRFANANTSATPTLNANAVGADTIKKGDGAALVAGDITDNHEAIVRHNGTDWILLNPTTASIGPVAIRDISRGLYVTSTGNPRVPVVADEIILQDASGIPLRVASVNLPIIDITASGANGLDTGVKAATTWYFVWVISNGTTTAGLLSLSATAPTMPSGYTYKALVSAARTITDSTFNVFYQYANRVEYSSPRNIKDGSFTATTWTSIVTTDFFPTTARKIRCALGSTSGILGLSAIAAGVLAEVSRTTPGASEDFGILTTARGAVTCPEIIFHWSASGTIYYYVGATTSTLDALGWEF